MKNGMKKAILFQITSRAFVSLIPRRVSIENATKNSASHKMCIFPSTFLWDSIETSKFRELLSISNGESVGIHERLDVRLAGTARAAVSGVSEESPNDTW